LGLELLYPMLLGLERLETPYLLTRHGVLQERTGLPTSPNATTLRRFIFFDPDSTVVALSGHQLALTRSTKGQAVRL
jgi:hypothetical protein